MKCLIVDDVLENRKLLHGILSPLFSCDLAVDGLEAIRFVEMALESGEPYDVIFLDIMMPRLDGQSALIKIREMEKERGLEGSRESVVIMVTANDSPLAALEAYFKGYCTDYLLKPITRQTLLDKLREYRLVQDKP
ncbi:MAG: response regulator [Magnetococcales bacterium]|nr:response regulator [Magnetococcales bacterium]MBF0321699.1 response regulator [Magnetococcales bacterium]